MSPIPGAAEYDEGVLMSFDGSTAPTTPEGSVTFSPALRAVQTNGDVDEFPASSQAGGRLVHVMVEKICCVGAGYVGGPTAAIMALQNPKVQVTVVDKDEGKIRRWNSQHPPIYEPGLREIVRIARDGSREFVFPNGPTCTRSPSTSPDGTADCPEYHSEGCMVVVPGRQPNLFFSTNVAESIREADIVLIAVNTPTKSKGIGAGSATDMASFEAVTAVVAQHAKPNAIIVEKSTVPCRTSELVKKILSVHRPGVHFEILSNPEFLAAGTAVKDLLHPDRIIIGSAPSLTGQRAAEALAGIYSSWVPRRRILTTNVWSSELSKLVANSMLAQRISSINSISAICEKTGADVDEVAASIGSDKRIGNKFLRAGIGFGGSCFKKDILSLVYLAESLGLPEVGQYWRQVVIMNEYQRDRFSRRVIDCLNNTLKGKKITILGYAFKKNTDDTRESPALETIRTLLEEGPAEIAIFDPCCNPIVVRNEIQALLGEGVVATDGGPVVVYEGAEKACFSSNAIVIMTDFDEFRTSTPPASGPATPSAIPTSKDPRPFDSVRPSENDLMALQRYLVTNSLGSLDPSSDDSLHRLFKEPRCGADCPDCKQVAEAEAKGFPTGIGTDEYKPRERLDWAKIAYHMRKPKWVFDGRGVVEPKALAKLNVRVESIGRQNRV